MTNFISFEAEFENSISENIRSLRQQQQADNNLCHQESKTLTD